MTKYDPADDDFEGKIANLALKELEREHKLPPGYLMALRSAASDWDFIVKLSLIIEAFLTRALVLELGTPHAYKTVSNLRQCKRLLMAQKLGLVEKAEQNMLISISKIRNAFVHRIENLTRPLTAYFHELTPATRNSIAKSILGVGIPGQLGQAGNQLAINQFADNFRPTVIRALFPTLLKLGTSYEIEQREKKYSKWRAEQERRLGRPLPPRIDFYLSDRLMVLELLAAEVPSS